MSLIRKNPKIFLGYSDITVLHLMILQGAGFCTFHGPMPSTEFCKETFEGYVKNALLRALSSPEPLGEILPYEGAPPVQGLVSEVAEGELTGGCLSLICALLGTPWEIDTVGKILVFEDINEEPYKIDRMLCSLRMAGKLRDAAAVVVGQIGKGGTQGPRKESHPGGSMGKPSRLPG